MMHFFKCEVSIRFDDKDVNYWLVCNEEIDDDEEETHVPTYDECQRYAWECVENEDCEYGSCEEA